jgi:hypothetical protein
MSYARDLALDGLRGELSQDRLATWYQAGLSDGLGDRLLMFDNSSSPSLELLRFRPNLTATPGFEVALRERVRRLSHFQHEGFARVRTAWPSSPTTLRENGCPKSFGTPAVRGLPRRSSGS